MGKYRKVIHISAEHSPNVKLAQEQIERGEIPSNEIVIPGILPYADYLIREHIWDEMRKCISLRGQFWEGSQVMMFPTQWLGMALVKARELRSVKKRIARGIGIDPGEGEADTALCAVDEMGIFGLDSYPTSDTSDIPGMIIGFGNRHNASSDTWLIDRGGGGKQHADVLRARGYEITSIGFGETPSSEPKHGIYTVLQRLNIKEEKSAYANRRAQMYYEARYLLNPDTNPNGFGIPGGEQYKELVRQLSLIPLQYDQNGKIYLPPKNLKPGQKAINGKPTLSQIIGRSPDQADSFVLACHRMLHGESYMVAGTFENDRDTMSISERIQHDLMTGARVSSKREREKEKGSKSHKIVSRYNGHSDTDSNTDDGNNIGDNNDE